MYKLRLLRINFNLELAFNDLPDFRGAVAKVAGREHLLFHNHIDDQKLRYRYPLIQFKLINRKAALFCIQEGVEEIEAFFYKTGLLIDLNGSPIPLKVEYLRAYHANLNIYDTTFRYNIINWLALNEKNYRLFRLITDEEGQIGFLEKILTGNILSMAKGLGYRVEKEIQVRIIRIRNRLTRIYKDTRFQVFNIEFETNFYLPDYMSLGKNSSIGYGMVRRIWEKARDTLETL